MVADRDARHAAGGRGDLRPAGRPLRAPHPAHGQPSLLLDGRDALRVRARTTRPSSSCARSSASAWEGSGASGPRSRWRARRGAGAECCRGSSRAATRWGISSRRSPRAWFYRPGAGARCSGSEECPRSCAFYVRWHVPESEAWLQKRAPDVRAIASVVRRLRSAAGLPRRPDDDDDVSLARDAGPLSRLPQDRARDRSEDRRRRGDHLQRRRRSRGGALRPFLATVRPAPLHGQRARPVSAGDAALGLRRLARACSRRALSSCRWECREPGASSRRT